MDIWEERNAGEPFMETEDEEDHGSYECPNCHDEMEYKGLDEEGGWLFVCPSCLNEAHELDGTVWFKLDPEDDYDEYYNDIPEGCRACGGDYPNCTGSCNLMND